MTSFKPGQKVTFISVRETGVVSRIEGDLVYVEIEKGFEIPTFPNDLILLEDVPKEPKRDEVESLKEKIDKTRKQKTHVHLEKGLYFSVIPLSDQVFECYMVNYTPHIISFHLVGKGKNFPSESIHYDLLQAGDAVLVMEKSYKELLPIETLLLQCMIIDVKEHQFFDSIVQDFSVNWNNLLTKEVFQPNPFFDEEAYIVKILGLEQKITRIGELPVQQNVSLKKEVTRSTDAENKSFLIDRFMIDEETAEVDLHADKILSPSENIHPSEILRRQMSFARQCLDSAREKGIKHLIFIHGTGKGTLKFELYSMLRKEENIRYGEASLLKYGGGAIEVIILS